MSSHPSSVSSPNLRRGFLAFFGFLLGAAGALPSLRASEDVTPNPKASADAWVRSDLPGSNNNGTNLTTTSAKDIYIKFKLPLDVVKQAAPLAVRLRLWKIGGPAGDVNLSVFAANNDWDEATLKWSNRARVDYGSLLATAIVGAENGWIEIALTPPPGQNTQDYVSGPGEYTFCIRSDAPTDLHFQSKEGGNAPELALTIPAHVVGSDAEFTRMPTQVRASGNRYIDRYLAASDGAQADIDSIGYFDVTKQPYGARGDGSTDDTLAIQRAINEARDARVAVYFPPRDSSDKSYRVSGLIECVQGLVDYETVPYASTYNERWNHRDFSSILIGPSELQPGEYRPRLKIVDGLPPSSVFGSSAAPKPLLRFWSRGTGEGGTLPINNYSAASYNHLVRNLDIDLNGYPGAMGIEMSGAQGNAIEKLTINAQGAHAGISGLPGSGGSTTDVTILGGEYGIKAYEPNSSDYAVLLTHCTLLDDTTSVSHQKSNVAWSGLGAMVMVGCRIEGKGIMIGAGGGPLRAAGASWRGNLSIVDSTIEITGAGGPAVSGSRTLYLRNVYLRNVTPIADIRTVANPTPPTNDAGSVARPAWIGADTWFHVPEYYEGAYLDQYSGNGSANFPNDNEGPEITPSYINPASSADIRRLAAAPGMQAVQGGPPSGVLDRHAMPDVPMWGTSHVINVKTWTGLQALGTNVGDDAPAIQAAIDAAETTGQAVFIPRGDYRLKSTLVLKPTTVLFGLHKNISRLKASQESGSGFMSGPPKPLVQSPDDADATTQLADLMLLQRMNTPAAYLLDWQAGAGSAVQNINFDRRIVGGGVRMNFPLVKITGNGGGRWYNFQHQSSAHQNDGPGSNYRHLLIDGTTEALKFYMFNPETDEQNIYNAEIRNSSNIDVFQSKFEGRESPCVRVVSSSNVRWFGIGGNAYVDAFPEGGAREDGEAFIEISDSSDYLFSSWANQSNFLKKEDELNKEGQVIGTIWATDPLKFNRLKETLGGSIIVTPGQKPMVVFRRGDPDDHVPGVPAGGNTPPAVQIQSPGQGMLLPLEPATITAAASDADGSVAFVNFYVNGAFVGTDATAPYGVSWTPPAEGGYTLVAAAFDNAGASTGSVEVNVGVLAAGVVSELILNSVGAEDGRVIESTATSGVGGNNFPGGTGSTAMRIGDDATNRQQKSIVSFDTSTLPAGAIIVGASLELNRGGGAQGSTANLGDILVDIRTGGFGNGNALENVDFESPATATQVAVMSAPAGDGAWSVGELNQAGLDAINRSGGRTQFRVYYSIPDNGNNTQDFLPFLGGASTVPANRPILRIEYALAPVITAPPTDQNATVGDTVTFSVTATGAEPLAYQWRRDGAALTGNASAQTATLILAGVGTGAAGSYDCVVTNAIGSATSVAATLTVATGGGGGGPGELVFVSVGSEDGRVIESTATSEVGGNTFPNATGSTALRMGDDGSNRQFRNIVSFDTSTIPSDAIITGASLELNHGSGAQGSTADFGAILVDIRTGAFGTGNALENVDFQSPATATAVATMSVPASVGAWSVGQLNQAGLDAINRSGGRTQFRVYHSIPDNGNSTQDFLPFFGGASTTPGTQPILRISYASASAQAPTITSSPTDQSAIAGDTVSFAVTATDAAPSALTYQWRHNGTALTGNASAQTSTLTLAGVGTDAAGTYDCVVSNAAGSVTSAAATLTVAKALAGVTLGGLSQAYDGTPRAVTASTTPAGLAVVLSYAGSATAPTNAGSYAVTAMIVDPDYFGETTGTLTVAKAMATMALAPLNQLYDGTPRVVNVITVPADLNVTLTYDGNATAPVFPGSCEVAATVDDENYSGAVVDTLVVATSVTLRHPPSVNGGIDGSVQILLPGNVTLNGSAWISGDLLVPGTPVIQLNGNPHFAGVLDGPGGESPAGHRVMLNGGSVLRHLVRRTDPVELPVVAAPPLPAGTRNVSLNTPSQTIGDPATLRNLTLNGSIPPVALPPGTYGTLSVNGSNTLTLGTVGAEEPETYHLQGLTLNGNATLLLAGPVRLHLATGVTLNASAGDELNPNWLTLEIASGGLVLNGNTGFHGVVVAPAGTVIINGSSTLRGRVTADRLILNGNGLLGEAAP